jgi:hypothetical protein
MRAEPATATYGRAASRRLPLLLAVLGVLAAVLLVVVTGSRPPGAAAQSGPAAPQRGIWISGAELRRLPTRGKAWSGLAKAAHEKLGRPNLSRKDDDDDTTTLAAALASARTGSVDLRRKAAQGVMEAIGTEQGGRTLSLGRGLVAYVVAADLIDLRRLDPAGDAKFRAWLRDVRFERLRPKSRPTLVATHEVAPNNWGTHAGASRIAADIYLGDRADLARAAAVFKGYLGDRGAYHGFRFGADLSWQADPSQPVGVVGAGAVKAGQPLSGALPDDMRRGCPMQIPPCPTGYPWEAMQGAVMQAELLSRQGYDAWNWGDRALERAAAYLMDLASRYGAEAWRPSGNDVWVAWLLNRRYGMRLPVSSPTRPGRGMGFTDWTEGPGSRCPPQSCAAARGRHRTVIPVAGGPIGMAERSSARSAYADVTGPMIAIAALGPLAVVALVLRRGRRR